VEFWIYRIISESKRERVAMCATENQAEEIAFILNKWEESKNIPPKNLWEKKDFN
jgi:hypothetical protein